MMTGNTSPRQGRFEVLAVVPASEVLADIALALRTLRAEHVGPDRAGGGGVLGSANGGAGLQKDCLQPS